jgi:alkanesulfonate monooxygenase SsuD/methylene tetrahydromethanopterin reductase-like flavin-dependent oxidoreductase (luciferase family)
VRYGFFLPNFGPFGDPNVLIELAREAEQSDWDGFFVWDHILFQADGGAHDVVDPWVALAGIAANTTRLRFGALMTPLARRRPWKVARETATLDRLSNGRLVFGAGLGFPPDQEFEFFGDPSDDRVRAQRLDEGLAILNGLWSGKPFSFTGEHYTLEEMQFLPTPVQQPRPPVWIAGWWPHKPPFRRAARWDGVFPERADWQIPTPDDLSQILAYVREQRADGTNPSDVVLNGHTPPDQKAGAAHLEPYLEVGLTWWLERVDLEHHYSVDEALARIRSGPPKP